MVEKAPKATKVEKTEQQEKSVAKANKELAVVIPEKGGRDLLDVLKEVDECFLKAAESGENVSRMLETRKVHYHSSFSDSLRGKNCYKQCVKGTVSCFPNFLLLFYLCGFVYLVNSNAKDNGEASSC